MPTSYEEWKNYDPDDPIYLSTAERAQKDMEAGLGHAKTWGKNVGRDLAYGAPMWATGLALSRVPFAPVRGAGNLMKWLGGMQMQWAPVTATRQTINDITKPVEPPQTDEQHLPGGGQLRGADAPSPHPAGLCRPEGRQGQPRNLYRSRALPA